MPRRTTRGLHVHFHYQRSCKSFLYDSIFLKYYVLNLDPKIKSKVYIMIVTHRGVSLNPWCHILCSNVCNVCNGATPIMDEYNIWALYIRGTVSTIRHTCPGHIYNNSTVYLNVSKKYSKVKCKNDMQRHRAHGSIMTHDTSSWYWHESWLLVKLTGSWRQNY